MTTLRNNIMAVESKRMSLKTMKTTTKIGKNQKLSKRVPEESVEVI